MPIIDQPTGEPTQQEFEIDSETLARIEGGEDFEASQPATDEKAPEQEGTITQVAAPAAQAAPAEQAPEVMVPVEYRGETKEVPISTLKNYYQQAWNLDEKYKEFNTEKERFEIEQREKAERYAELEKYNQYAQQNPAWAQAIREGYNKRHEVQANQIIGEMDPNDPNTQVLKTALDQNAQLAQQVQGLQETVGKFQDHLQKQEALEGDAMLEQQISETRKKFPGVDFDALDERGVKLADKITHWGVQRGIPHFEASAYLYLGDNLLKAKFEEGRKAAFEQSKQAKQQGIIGAASSAKRDPAPTPYKATGNYNNALQAAMDELGIKDY